jgi:peptidoglycan/LPS O-acetylase OafA/YrhL
MNLPVHPLLLEIAYLFPGVLIFFLISGFLISRSFLQRPDDLARYAVSRALRIYPALWLNLTFIFGLMLLSGIIRSLDLRFIISTATLFITSSLTLSSHIWQRFYWNDLFRFFPNGVIWTIPVELTFYLAVPVIFALRRLALWIALVALTMSSVGLALAEKWEAGLLPYLWIFLIGAVINLQWSRLTRLLEGTFPIWLALYLAESFLVRHFHEQHQFVPPRYSNVTLASLPQTLMLAGCVFSFAYSFKSLSARLLRGVDISYGLYLWHCPIMAILIWLGFKSSISLWPVVIIGVAAASYLSWFLVERRCLSAKSLLVRRLKSAAARKFLTRPSG